ncbi:monovalent cation/H(+) antiporter subunit G [Marivita sp. GX14005]|uniref:monovalent cation/H(+) antiporter subunit G n=1 Tax=Marivita sp. GX14005 TaxID=2942276 RepID=UPI002018C1D2|nr:monovalent cation/H(+) antiporter subunit G [Marivita sp. GX14005]MCL3881198.1 monovalent cation/H(+) antiporter subunit G [Marivita sp. GX14005]
MTLQIIGIYATGICLLIGAGFVLVGVIGLLKFNDSMTRLHAPTKVGTMGIGMLLLGSMLHSFSLADGSFHETLIMAFLFVTAPISANFIAKVHLHRRDCTTPPPPPRDDTWSSLEGDLELQAGAAQK